MVRRMLMYYIDLRNPFENSEKEKISSIQQQTHRIYQYFLSERGLEYELKNINRLE